MIRTALAEAAWLRGDRRGCAPHVAAAGEPSWAAQFGRPAGELALWAARCGERLERHRSGARAGDLRELGGDWRGAIRGWHELEAPYEAALAALPGDERAAREAMASATPARRAAHAARAFARARSERRDRAPRGPQRSTLANVAGLTRREQEVLVHVAAGATNAADRAGAPSLRADGRASRLGDPRRSSACATRTAAVDAAHAAGALQKMGRRAQI